MKFFKIFLFLLLTCMGVTAEPLAQNGRLQGVVTDKVDNSPLTGVVVSIPELSKVVVTNVQGQYDFEALPSKKVTIQVSYIGHQTIIKTVDLATVSSMNFVMKESNATIDEVVVTGLSGKLLMKESPTPVSTISQRDLLTTSSTNMIDALARQPGISQITTGGGISKPVIRGLGYNRIVVVNDGVRQEGQQWGDEHGIEIDGQGVNNVEVLKGPASLMYGSDAMAGVVIFHSDPVLAQGQMKAVASSEYQTNNGLFDYSLNFAGNKKDIVWDLRYSDKMAHAYQNKYDGYVFNSQFKEKAASAMVGLNRNWGYSHLKFSYYHLTPSMVEGDRDETTGAFLKPALVNGQEDEVIATDYQHLYGHGLPYQQIHHYKAVLDNSFYIGKGNLKAIVGYQQNRRQEFEDVETPDKSGLDFRLHTVNYDVNYALPLSDNWKFTGGANGMYQRSLNQGDEFLIPAYHLFDIGAFVTSGLTLNQWHLSGGARIDNRSLRSEALENRFAAISRNFSGLTGSIGAVYDILNNMHVRLNAARGFRAPNLSELASNGVHEGTQRYETGNADLKPEYSWQIDAGFDYSSAVVSVQASLFMNLIDNYIFSHRTGGMTDGVPTYRFVQGDARLQGGEVSVDVHPVERLHFMNSFSYVNAVQLHQPEESKYLPLTPAPKWTSELRYDLVRDGSVLNNTFVKLGLECNLRQDHFYSADDTETATPSYTLLNMSVGTDIMSHRRTVASIFLIGDNLTDRAYQSHLSRLKYTDINNATGRQGVFNMGRNICIKVVLPVDL